MTLSIRRAVVGFAVTALAGTALILGAPTADASHCTRTPFRNVTTTAAGQRTMTWGATINCSSASSTQVQAYLYKNGSQAGHIGNSCTGSKTCTISTVQTVCDAGVLKLLPKPSESYYVYMFGTAWGPYEPGTATSSTVTLSCYTL